MSRKDFEMIAETIRHATGYMTPEAREALTNELALRFGNAYPRFDAIRFIQASIPDVIDARIADITAKLAK